MNNAKVATMVNGKNIWLAPDEELRSFEVNNCSWNVGDYVGWESKPNLYWNKGRRPYSCRVVAIVSAPYETGGVMWANTKVSVVVR